MSVIGIDFGDQNSFVAVARQGGIEIVLNDFSQRQTPSCVAFGSEQRMMGVAAKQQHGLNARNTVSGFKETVGRQSNDPVVQQLAKTATYRMSNSGPAGVEVELKGERLQVSMEQITSMLLNHLRECAQNYIKAGIVDCVLSVPSFWTDAQRRALLDAAKISGLNVLKLMNETTAVALNYGIYKQDLPEDKEKPRYVAFLDVGHSATQAYIAEFYKGKLEMKAVVFEPNLGGRDMTMVMRDHFVGVFRDKYKLDVPSNQRAILRLTDECEKLKKQMSANSTEIPINIECFMQDKDVTGKLKRADFEDLCGNIWSRLESLLRSLLKQAKLTASDIHSCELVGGSSRVPRIKSIVKQVFNSEPSTTLNADEAVAKGCALQGAILSPAFRVRDFNLTDIQPYSIKLCWTAEKSEDGEWEAFAEGHQFPFSKLLTFYRSSPFTLEASYTMPNHIPYPSTFIGRYVISNVTPLASGESRKVKAKIRINPNGLFLVSSAHMYEPKPVEEQEEKKAPKKTPPRKAKQKSGDKQASEEAVPAETNDNADGDKKEAGEENGDSQEDDATVDDDADEKVSEKKKIPMKQVDLPIQVDKVYGLSDQQISDSQDFEARLARQDADFKARTDAKNSLEEYVYDMRDKLSSDYADFISPANADRFRQELDAIEEWIYDDGADQSKQVYDQKLSELRKKGDPVVERFMEAKSRPAAFDELGHCIMRARKVLDAYQRRDPAYEHLQEADIETVEKWVTDKTNWYETHLNRQQQRPKYEPPVITVQEIQEQKRAFESVVNPIINKPKPKVEPPKDPPAEKTEQKDEPMTENGPADKKQEQNMEVD